MGRRTSISVAVLRKHNTTGKYIISRNFLSGRTEQETLSAKYLSEINSANLRGSEIVIIQYRGLIEHITAVATFAHRFKKKAIKVLANNASSRLIENLSDFTMPINMTYRNIGDDTLMEDKLILESLQNVSDLEELKENAPHIIRSSNKIKDLANRIELAADALSDMRLNSASDVIAELRSISDELHRSSVDPGVEPQQEKAIIKETLFTLSKLFDAIENSRLAAMAVAGATTAIIDAGGWSSVACLGVSLASWHGKDTFIAALEKLSPAKLRLPGRKKNG